MAKMKEQKYRGRNKMLNDIIKNIENDMQKCIESFKAELSKLRTGRASSGLVDGIKVDYYGNETALQHVANVTTSDARTISIVPWEKSMLKPIEKAILSADLGLNPIVDSDAVRIPIPALTEERRKEMAKLMRNISEQSKVSVRNVRRDAMTHIKELLKSKELDEDSEHRAQDTVQKITDKFIAEIDKLTTSKEAELMKI